MYDFATAALKMMDDQGIALQKRTYQKRQGIEPTNGNGNGHAPAKNLDALREKVTRQCKERRAKTSTAKAGKAGKKQGRPSTAAQEPDGKHVTLSEAAEILNASPSHVRDLTKRGDLPKVRYENRVFAIGKGGSRTMKTMVVPREAVEDYKAAQAANA